MAKAEAGTKGASIEDVLAHNSELSEQILRQGAEIKELREIALAGMGVDATLANLARNKKRELVQFLQNYGRAPLASPVQKGMFLIEGYNIKKGDVVLLPVEEIERLRHATMQIHEAAANGKTKPVVVPLIEPDRKKFTSVRFGRHVQKNDARGAIYYEREEGEIEVADLIKRAYPVG